MTLNTGVYNALYNFSNLQNDCNLTSINHFQGVCKMLYELFD